MDNYKIPSIYLQISVLVAFLMGLRVYELYLLLVKLNNTSIWHSCITAILFAGEAFELHG